MRPEQNVLPGRRLAEHEPHGRRLRAADAGRTRSPSSASSRRAPRPSSAAPAAPPRRRGTRSGSNQLHGNLCEFVRNDAFDARNFFSADVEPLKQHQFGGTLGGPIRARSRSSSATTKAAATRRASRRRRRCRRRRSGTATFSGMATPLLNLAAGGTPFPGNQSAGAGDQPGRAQRG